jgi:pimeloyl-ACP methyl ester carboxylesterase
MPPEPFADAAHVTVNGASLAYHEQGAGEPVVFVHGGVSDLRAWDAQLPEIGRSFRAISYSRRFARPNAPIDPDSSDRILEHVDDLAGLAKEICGGSAHLVGNSYGALICLLTALRHPEVVRSLVLEEPPAITLFVPRIPPHPAQLLSLLLTRPRTALALLRFVVGTVARVQRAFERGDDAEGLRLFTQGVLGSKPLEEIPEAIRKQTEENIADLRALMLHPEPESPPLPADELRSVRMPVLLVTGEWSPAFLVRLIDRLEELIPLTQRVEIPDASHIMHAERPDAVNQVLLDFLEGQRGEMAGR